MITKIDSVRMTHGKEVAAKLRKGRGGGIPWMVILDSEGRELITSDGPKGNVGCPVTPEEVSWFMKMIMKTSQHMTAADAVELERRLETFASRFRRR